jgi:hypothetical protein
MFGVVAGVVPLGPAGVVEVVGAGAVCEAAAAGFGVARLDTLVAVMATMMAAGTSGSGPIPMSIASKLPSRVATNRCRSGDKPIGPGLWAKYTSVGVLRRAR